MIRQDELIHCHHLDLAAIAAASDDEDVCNDCLTAWIVERMQANSMPGLRTGRDAVNLAAGVLIGVRAARIKDGAPDA